MAVYFFRVEAGEETRHIEVVDGHVEYQRRFHLVAKAAKMRADEEITGQRIDLADDSGMDGVAQGDMAGIVAP